MDRDKLIYVKQTFALWCASTAAWSSPKCRFSTDQGTDIAHNSFLLCYKTLDELFENITLQESGFPKINFPEIGLMYFMRFYDTN